MKKIIMIMDEDPIYSKKFCNQAIKVFGKKYLFLTFSSIKAMKEYATDNKVESVIVSEAYVDNVEDIKINSIYILNEKNKNTKREGKKIYVYKLQNIKNILSLVDEEIEKRSIKEKKNENMICKVVLFYSPTNIENKKIIIRKIAKNIDKKKKVLILNIDEFSNYKGSVGLSNIIFNYKENILNADRIKKEIISDKDQDFINSVTYPEDFNVISNIDIANIVNEIKVLDYDYLFINSDESYTKCQYIFNDADEVVLLKEKDNEMTDKFKSYIKSENQMDIKKITEYDISKKDKSYISAFIKECFEKENE